MIRKRHNNYLANIENLESRRPLAGDVMVVAANATGVVDMEVAEEVAPRPDPTIEATMDVSKNEDAQTPASDVGDTKVRASVAPPPVSPRPVDNVLADLHGNDHSGDTENTPLDPINTLAGDANRDGLFDSSDLIQVFQAGKFETGEMAVWEEGDFDGNELFDTGDLIAAFQVGHYEAGADDVFQENPNANGDPKEPGETDPTDGRDDEGNNDDTGESSVFEEEGASLAHHVIRRDDGGWTDEYRDYDKAGNLIGRTHESFDKNGTLRERTVTRTHEDGSRTTTTETYDEDGKWTGSTTEEFDEDGNLTVGAKSTPNEEGGVTEETYEPANGAWVPTEEGDDQVPQLRGGRRAHHHIGRADGGWTDEYVDLDRDGNSIGRTSESFNKRGMMTERRTTRNGNDGSRSTTTETYDDEGKWTGTTQETFDKQGNQTGGTRTVPNGQGGATTQTYNPQTGSYE